MTKSCVIIGLGKIGMGYDYDLTGSHVIYTHARGIVKHPKFQLVGAVDVCAKQRERFEKHYLLPTFNDPELALGKLQPDVVVIATPTGSTSYAMSLGSPILYPTMESNIIVPMAAYRIGARPLVIPSKYDITAKLTGNSEAVMVLDGQEEILVKIEDSIKLKKSKSPVSIVRFKDNFFDRVRTKLRM